MASARLASGERPKLVISRERTANLRSAVMAALLPPRGPTGMPMRTALVSTVTSSQGDPMRPLRISSAAGLGQLEASGTHTVF